MLCDEVAKSPVLFSFFNILYILVFLITLTASSASSRSPGWELRNELDLLVCYWCVGPTMRSLPQFNLSWTKMFTCILKQKMKLDRCNNQISCFKNHLKTLSNNSGLKLIRIINKMFRYFLFLGSVGPHIFPLFSTLVLHTKPSSGKQLFVGQSHSLKSKES